MGSKARRVGWAIGRARSLTNRVRDYKQARKDKQDWQYKRMKEKKNEEILAENRRKQDEVNAENQRRWKISQNRLRSEEHTSELQSH